MLGKIEGMRRRDDRGWDSWMASLDMGLGELRELVMDREAWCATIHGVAKNRTQLRDWTELMAQDAMILVFWMLSSKPTFSLSSFTFIKRFFSSSSLSAIGVMSSVYLRFLIFLPAILTPACASSSLAFHIMYFAYKLNKQGDNIQPWHTPFLVWNQSVFPCPVLAIASWPSFRFLRSQVRWSGIPISFRIFQSLLSAIS